MKKDEEVKKAMPSDHSMDLPKKDKAKTVCMIIAIVALVALIGLGIYGYTQMQKTNQKIKDQQAQIDELNDTKKTLEDTAAAAAKAATDAAAKAVTGAAKGSDEDQINQAVTNYVDADSTQVKDKTYKIEQIIIDKTKTFASVSIGGYSGSQRGGGYSVILKKVNGVWVVLFAGQQTPEGYKERYSLPDNF